MDYINHLLAFSSKIISLELDKTSVNKIIWLQETYCQEDYLDPYCDSFQVNLIKAKDNMLERIINNFDEAIKSKCGNDIDLSEYSGKEHWDYEFETDNEQGSISKRYYDIKLTPKDEKVFKKLWLRHYITVLSEIVSNIRTVTNNPKQVGIDKSKNDRSELKKDSAEAISNNPYPLLFVSGEIYEKFISFCNKPMVHYYLEISYLKKRMEHESFIHRIKDNDFMKIIFQEMKLISKKDHADYLIKNKLTSLNKSATENRENHFNHIFLD
tara:strand:+ start:145 stop:951 length:807 start_codon:yes stop_codon:yes gene_type:complete